MRQLDPSFESDLKSGVTTLCMCWRIIRKDGRRAGFTDCNREIVFDGTHFLPETAASGSVISSGAGLSVDNSEIEGALSADALSGEDLAAGRYDGARVEIFRVNWNIPDRRVLLKVCILGEIRREGNAFRAEMRGVSGFLEQPTGRVYQRLCDVAFGSAECGIDASSPEFSASCTVNTAYSRQKFSVTGIENFSPGWFRNGLLSWKSGAGVHTDAHIRNDAENGMIDLWVPAGFPVRSGDRCVLTAGCDKKFGTCREKFSNAVNFRGFHLMPGNDFVLSYPSGGDVNDGGRRG